MAISKTKVYHSLAFPPPLGSVKPGICYLQGRFFPLLSTLCTPVKSTSEAGKLWHRCGKCLLVLNNKPKDFPFLQAFLTGWIGMWTCRQPGCLMGWKKLSTSILSASTLARWQKNLSQGGIHFTDGNCSRLMPAVHMNISGSPSGDRGTVVAVCALHESKQLGSSPRTTVPWHWHSTDDKLVRAATWFSLCRFATPQIILFAWREYSISTVQLFPWICKRV